MGHGADTNCDICVSKFAAGLTKLVSSSDTAVHSPGPACCKYHYTSCHLTHTHRQMYTGRPQSPQLVLQAAHYCTILARLNHSLMGGLTDWYCYSLWGLALHTNRRLSRSRCQQRRSGYLHAYNGLEWNPTGGNLPCPPGTSECHNMGYLEGRGDSGEGYRQSVKNCDPYVTSYMQTTLPWGSQDLLRSRAIESNSLHARVRVLRASKPLLFHFWETDPLLLCYPSQPYQFPFFPDIIRNCLNHPETT